MRVRLGNFHAGRLKVGAIDFQWPLFARGILKLSAILFHRHKRCRLRDYLNYFGSSLSSLLNDCLCPRARLQHMQ